MPRLSLCLFLILLATLASGCRPRGAPSTAPAATQPAGSQAKSAATENSGGPVKQLIVIYSGDTLSIPTVNDDYDPPQGGLPALANAIMEYEGQILTFNQLRVENEGGDPTKLRADFDTGMIGDNPFLLLDYGFWERKNDPVGESYVKLYFAMQQRLRYTAVASALITQLAPQTWHAYSAAMPQGFRLLSSAGSPQTGAPDCDKIVVREIYGRKWGIVSIPVPAVSAPEPRAMASETQRVMESYVREAAAQLTAAGCETGILLATGGPSAFYKALKNDTRFSVVIGAPPAVSAAVGFGDMPASGPLFLPALNGGGRELAACHLIYAPGGATPRTYNLVRLPCADDGRKPYPYRAQVAQAVAEHQAATAKHKASAEP